MKRFAPLWFVLVVGVLSVGCDDALICPGGGCVDLLECIDNCEFACEGEVIEAVCDEVAEVCTCECEFQCVPL